MNKEQMKKCEVCRENDIKCIYTPILSSEEAAKIITKHESSISKLNLRLYRVGNDAFIIGKKEWEVKGKLFLEDVIFKRCPFYDTEERRCRIEENKPGFCKDIGVHPKHACPFKNFSLDDMKKLDRNQLEYTFVVNQTFSDYLKERFGNINSEIFSRLGFKNLTKIPNYTGGKYKKLLKQNKENFLMFNIVNFIYGAFESEGLGEKEHLEVPNLIRADIKYKLLVEEDGKRVTTTRARHYDSDNPILKPLMRLYNRLIFRFTLMPNEYLTLLYEKSKKLASVLENKKDCIDKETFDKNRRLQYLTWMFMSIVLLETWKTSFKNKSKDYQNLYTADDMSRIKDYIVREIQKELGLEETGWSFRLLTTEGPIKCMADNMTEHYKRILKTG